LINYEGKNKHYSGSHTATNCEIDKLEGRGEDDVNSFERQDINQEFDYFFIENKANEHCSDEKAQCKKNSFSNFR